MVVKIDKIFEKISDVFKVDLLHGVLGRLRIEPVRHRGHTMALGVNIISVNAPSDQEADNPAAAEDDDDVERPDRQDPALVRELEPRGGLPLVIREFHVRSLGGRVGI